MNEHIREELAEISPDSILYDGLDEALIGWADIWRGNEMVIVAVYGHQKIRKLHMDRDGMTAEESEEYISFNITGGYLGIHTPVIVMEGGSFGSLEKDSG